MLHLLSGIPYNNLLEAVTQRRKRQCLSPNQSNTRQKRNPTLSVVFARNHLSKSTISYLRLKAVQMNYTMLHHCVEVVTSNMEGNTRDSHLLIAMPSLRIRTFIALALLLPSIAPFLQSGGGLF